MSEFQIRKDQFATNRIVASAADALNQAALSVGSVLLKIDRFAFTANNMTYAAIGDKLGYWQFFPPSGADAEGWGIIPVWGFADVVASKSADVPVGERLFGYFPPASFVTLLPTKVTPQRLFDGTAHRAKLPPGYNSYTRIAAEPGYDNSMDSARMLLWPLHMTSFCLWDKLKDNAWYGARQVVILSASSKTSIGLAYALAMDSVAPPVIAATSTRNLGFVSALGLYQHTLAYESLSEIDASIPTVIVDLSGNSDVLARLHTHLGDQLTHCINVGLTHWNATAPKAGINTARSEFFFAPGHIQQRMKDWGAEVFATKTGAFLKAAGAKSQTLLNFTQLDGLAGLAAVYPDVCDGRIAPDQGLIVQL